MIIAGLGTAVPEFAIRQEHAAAIATTMCHYDDSQSDRIRKLYRLTRVEKRHSVLLNDGVGARESQDFFAPSNGEASLGPPIGARMQRYEHHAPLLALEAAGKALHAAGVEPGRVTHLITVSCSGFAAPGVDIALIKELGLPPDTQRTHIGFMGCHAALNGIRVARGFIQGDPGAVVLLAAVEICSVHYQYSAEDETNLANGLFSDGAGALVLSAGREASAGAWRVADTGSCILPDSEDAMTWRVRDHGFQMTLGRQVPALIHSNLLPWLERWLAGCGLTPAEIATWGVHPGGPAILQSVTAALSLRKEDLGASWEVLREFGNMSSPTILFVLDRLQQADAPRPAVVLGFGPGLAVEAVLFR